jgi:hypothetical protein
MQLEEVCEESYPQTQRTGMSKGNSLNQSHAKHQVVTFHDQNVCSRD